MMFVERVGVVYLCSRLSQSQTCCGRGSSALLPWRRIALTVVCSPRGSATTIAYHLLHRSINHQVFNMVAKNSANLALSPTFRYVSIESPI
ncbi:hypothetical protein TNCV_4289231 [Trichonephila clavipes]|nr:hypothetical protein TNCV_4289231 [Trichonephila clavipes]